MVMEFNAAKNYNPIRKLINVLGQDFATSKDNNKRKGGLLGLAATSIGLGKVKLVSYVYELFCFKLRELIVWYLFGTIFRTPISL